MLALGQCVLLHFNKILIQFNSIFINNIVVQTKKNKAIMDGNKSEFVTLNIINQILETQDRAYRNTLQIFMDDMKSEIRILRKDVEDLKVSLQFSQGQIDDMKKVTEEEKIKLELIDDRMKFLEEQMKDSADLEQRCDQLESKREYLENMSRRNNIKIFGVAEEKDEKTWEDSENVVKKIIREKLDVELEGEHAIERAHRVGKPRPLFGYKKDGGRVKNPPRPIVAKFSNWKQKEAILRAARRINPKDVQFYQDLSARTLEKRSEKIPQLIAMRKEGKTAYLVLDQLVVRDKVKDRDRRSKPR